MSLKFPTLSLVVTKISLNFALCFYSIKIKVNNYGTQRSPFFMPFYDTL